MGLEVFDNYECEGQMSIDDVFAIEIPENLFAVSRIFARARKQMNLAEYKAFTYALSNLRFTEENSNKIMMDKKTLAAIVGVNSDPDHLSEDLKRSIGQLPLHSHIEIDDKDNDFYESGMVVTSLRMYKNKVCITLNQDYMPFFSRLEKNYITMWSGDIYQMHSERSITFYELLRENTDTRKEINEGTLGVQKFKELFNIPKDGKGSYMRKSGGFDRTQFERKVLDPLFEDMVDCKMINIVPQAGGKFYEKVKKNGRIIGYRFFWVFSSHPRVATATEVRQIQDRVDKNPYVLKIAKDIEKGNAQPKTTKKKNGFVEGCSHRCHPEPEKEKRYNDLLEKSLLGISLSEKEQAEFEKISRERNN